MLSHTTKAKLAAVLGKMHPDVQMLAIEIYVDKHAGNKDERYMAGVARRLAKRSDRDREADMNRHRRSMHGAGLLDSLSNSQPEGIHDGDHAQKQQPGADAFADGGA